MPQKRGSEYKNDPTSAQRKTFDAERDVNSVSHDGAGGKTVKGFLEGDFGTTLVHPWIRPFYFLRPLHSLEYSAFRLNNLCHERGVEPQVVSGKHRGEKIHAHNIVASPEKKKPFAANTQHHINTYISVLLTQ